jgi:hypothetical protein
LDAKTITAKKLRVKKVAIPKRTPCVVGHIIR